MSKSLIEEVLRAKLQTDEGMAEFLDKLFGPNNWTYDAAEDVWVTPYPEHTGPGRRYIVIGRGGNWFKTVVPDV